MDRISILVNNGGKITFVDEYEEGKEPLVKEGVDAFGSKLRLVRRR